MAHLVLGQSLGIGLVQNDLHDAEDLLCYRCPSTVLTLLLSYKRLTSKQNQKQLNLNMCTYLCWSHVIKQVECVTYQVQRAEHNVQCVHFWFNQLLSVDFHFDTVTEQL